MLFGRNELRPLLRRAAANDPDLTALHLSHKKITNKQLLQISDALKGNAHITEVWLTHNLISDETDGPHGGAGSVGYLASILEGNRSVAELYLGGNRIGAKGAASIAALLRTNRVLTDVGLEENNIGDGGAKMLADALAENATLQTLKLQGNDASEGTLKSIGELLKANREAARKKFEAEHPDRVTHKLKKPPPRKKEKKRRSRKGGERRRGGSSKGERTSSASRSKPSSARDGRSREAEPKAADAEGGKAALTLADRFRGLGFGGNKKQVAEDGAAGLRRNDGLARATFV
ncbi:hypothetical protein ACHAXT_005997 [Thalassiosira profunda]